MRRKGIEAGRIEQTAPAERKEEDREVSVTLKVVLRHALDKRFEHVQADAEVVMSIACIESKLVSLDCR